MSSTTTPVVPTSAKTSQTSPQGIPPSHDESKCPFCQGSTLVTKMGKTLSHVSGFLLRSFSIKIPTGVLNYIKEHTPVPKTAALKGQCKVCKGKGSIKDPSKIAVPVAEKVKADFQKNAKEITELENKLAPHGGNRYTVIQGSDLLEVGLGMNDAPSYSIIEGAGKRNKRLVAHSDLSSKGAPMFFEGADCNYVQGINSVASPGGHYFIKCSNKFSVMAGAQGIDLTTGGPITISGGITRISGPEITIGTQTGPLSLEGEVVNISGKSVEVSTSDGDFCVRGNISTTSNVRVGGHTHTESMSFVHGSCVGYNSWTDNASPSEFQTGPAFYGGMAAEGELQAALDLKAHILAKSTDPMNIKNLVGPAALAELTDKTLNITYQARPWELIPTGYILPGTVISLTLGTITGLATAGQTSATGGAVTGPITITGGTALATVAAPIILNNFPHTHSIPSQPHSHSIRLPAIDFSADTSEQLRSKQAGVENPAPLHKTSSITKTIEDGLQSLASTVFAPTWVTLNSLVKKMF